MAVAIRSDKMVGARSSAMAIGWAGTWSTIRVSGRHPMARTTIVSGSRVKSSAKRPKRSVHVAARLWRACTEAKAIGVVPTAAETEPRRSLDWG